MTDQTAEPELTGPQKAYNVAQSEMFQLAAYGHHRYHPSGEALTDEGKRQQRDYNDRIRAAREQLEATLLRLVAEHAETFTGKRVVSVEWLRSLADGPAALSLLAVRPDERDFDTDPAATPAGPAPATDRAGNESTASPDVATRAGQNLAFAMAPATDRDTLRISIAETLARTDGHTWGPGQSSLPSGVIERYHRLADAVLAVLPAPDQRAAVLLEAADVGENVANRIHASGDDHRAGGAYDVVDELRRLAGEAQQDETQAQPPHHRWSVETRDAVADQWAPGTPITDRDKAVERYEHVTKNWPTWKDGTPVQRRLVRATTTYTVEQGAVARPGQPETDEETDRA